MITESFRRQLQNSIKRIEHTPFLRRGIDTQELRGDYDQKIFERFFPLTKHFALSGMTYVAKICEKIGDAGEKTGAELEDLLCEILSISAGEFSGVKMQRKSNGMLLSGFRREAIHYNMFKETFCRIAQDDGLRPHSPVSKATNELIHLIRHNFSHDTLAYGFANYYVIETCAPTMVDALVHYLKPKLKENGCDCTYLTLHVKIEKHHASHVDTLLDRHFSNKDDQRFFETAHSQLCEAMEKYWDDISDAVVKGRS